MLWMHINPFPAPKKLALQIWRQHASTNFSRVFFARLSESKSQSSSCTGTNPGANSKSCAGSFCEAHAGQSSGCIHAPQSTTWPHGSKTSDAVSTPQTAHMRNDGARSSSRSFSSGGDGSWSVDFPAPLPAKRFVGSTLLPPLAPHAFLMRSAFFATSATHALVRGSAHARNMQGPPSCLSLPQ